MGTQGKKPKAIKQPITDWVKEDPKRFEGKTDDQAVEMIKAHFKKELKADPVADTGIKRYYKEATGHTPKPRTGKAGKGKMTPDELISFVFTMLETYDPATATSTANVIKNGWEERMKDINAKLAAEKRAQAEALLAEANMLAPTQG